MTLLPSLRILWWGGLSVVLVGSIASASHYHQRYLQATQTNNRLQQQMQQATHQLAIQQEQQQKVAILDQKLTGELTHEKKYIALLEQRVRAGERRLQLHARCPSAIPDAATSLAHAAPARLTDAAERNYFRLRRRIALIQSQVRGLQDYILLQSENSSNHMIKK